MFIYLMKNDFKVSFECLRLSFQKKKRNKTNYHFNVGVLNNNLNDYNK